MGAVYILLGCLSLSAVVILGILVYCTSQCWRRRCFKIQTACVRKSSVKLLSATDDGYLMLKHSRPSMSAAICQPSSFSAMLLSWELSWSLTHYIKWHSAHDLLRQFEGVKKRNPVKQNFVIETNKSKATWFISKILPLFISPPIW